MNKEITNLLANALKSKRERLNLSQREAAKESGVSASTFSRIEGGKAGTPDADTISILAAWLEMPLDRFMNPVQPENSLPVVYYPAESMPEIVRAHLMRDKNLTPENVERLAEIFRVSYEQFTEYSNAE